MGNRRQQLRRRAAMQREAERAVAKVLPIPAATVRERSRPRWKIGLKATWGLIGAVAIALGYWEFRPKVQFTPVAYPPPEARGDAARMPFEIKNDSSFAIKQIQLSATFDARGHGMTFSNVTFHNRFQIRRIGSGEASTVKPPSWLIPSKVSHMDLNADIEFRYWGIPMKKKFRWIGGVETTNQEPRWYRQPAK